MVVEDYEDYFEKQLQTKQMIRHLQMVVLQEQLWEWKYEIAFLEKNNDAISKWKLIHLKEKSSELKKKICK